MSGLAYLFPTFTMRASGERSDAPGLTHQLAVARAEVEAHVDLQPGAFRVPTRGERLSAEGTLQASYASLIEALACARWAERNLAPPSLVSSFSMGLFPALVHGEALQLDAALDLLTGIHGIAAQHSGDQQFAMAPIIGRPLEWVREQIAGWASLELSVDYGQTLTLVCGPEADIGRWIAQLPETADPEFRAFAFPIALPFHTSRLGGAIPEVAGFVADFDVTPPRHAIVSSSTAEVMVTTDDIRAELVRNIVSPIRWRGVLDRMLHDGVRSFVECGLSRELGDLLLRDEGERVEVHQFVASQVAPPAAENRS